MNTATGGASTPPLPIIALCQQPNGFLPTRFFAAKLATARRLQAEIGGEIVWVVHDSDHDLRETRTGIREPRSGDIARRNFAVGSKIERKYTPLSHKRIAPGWRDETLAWLHGRVDEGVRERLGSVRAETVGAFCIDAYAALGLLDGIRPVRTSDPAVRRRAIPVDDVFVDVLHHGVVVRARRLGSDLRLHAGGDAWIDLPRQRWSPEQVSPARDTRFAWQQSVVPCTHYIAGASEIVYLRPADFPAVTFVPRDIVEDPHAAWTGH